MPRIIVAKFRLGIGAPGKDGKRPLAMVEAKVPDFEPVSAWVEKAIDRHKLLDAVVDAEALADPEIHSQVGKEFLEHVLERNQQMAIRTPIMAKVLVFLTQKMIGGFQRLQHIIGKEIVVYAEWGNQQEVKSEDTVQGGG